MPPAKGVLFSRVVREIPVHAPTGALLTKVPEVRTEEVRVDTPDETATSSKARRKRRRISRRIRLWMGPASTVLFNAARTVKEFLLHL